MTKKDAGHAVRQVSLENISAFLNAFEVMIVLLARASESTTALKAIVADEIASREPSPSEAPNVFLLKRIETRLRQKTARLDRHPADSVDSKISAIERALELRTD